MIQPDIIDSIDLNSVNAFLPVSDRYYKHKYCIKFSTKEQNLDQRVSFHTNRICMISLAENHPVMKNNKKVAKINCTIDEKINRLLNSTSGKGKRGAQKLMENSILCYIECEDGDVYPVYSCVQGKLLEINENLISNPNLLVTNPVDKGYIALVLPMLNVYESMKNSMLDADEYSKL
ncbi:hypothetical protein PPYR_05076 [Photinus pyralis]|uniref:Protein Abitram n=1 Tax=Photinus pyralis TaxID=7054 RepID=A0A5N4B0F3_PHOPY|nr:protein Abitram-like [Photinus pyralis]KAB0802890.1 hypothetical protein PPYR_05076 [Photinus pyralis]